MQTAAQKLASLIRQFEGCRLKAYKCPAGVWTCGWGSTGPDVTENTVWTQAEADKRMEADAAKFLDGVLKFSPILKGHPSKLAAVADFAYNVGLGAYGKSTLRKMVDSEQWEAAVAEFRKWNKGGGKVLPGLVKRREAEVAMFLE